MTLAELSGPYAPPIHPQPGFYEGVVADLGYDAQAPIDVPLTHEEFSTFNAIPMWTENVLEEFDARAGRFDPERVAKAPRPSKRNRKNAAPRPPQVSTLGEDS